MNECETCNAPITKAFARVFGSNDGTVLACRNCSDDERVARSQLVRDYRRRGYTYTPPKY